MTLIDSPTLIYPVGGETLFHEVVQIQWEETITLALQPISALNWYEILFSTDEIDEDNRAWKIIAMIPVGNSTFDWKIPSSIRSKRCRIGIRVMSHTGVRGPLTMSSDVFSIDNKRLPVPGVISPIEGDIFFSYIPVVFDQGGFAGQFPRRAHYRVSYTSSSQELDWICIGDNIAIDTATTYLDVRDLNSAEDYSLKFELIDGEDSSVPVFINNLTINNLNFFKIDTVPPTGTVQVQNNAEYISNRDTILEITSYDITSGTESFKIIQKEIDRDDPDTEGPWHPLSNINSWRVVNDDGVKLIQISFMDYAGNILETNPNEFFFRTYKSVDNREVTALLVNPNGSSYDVWMAIGGVDPEIFLNGSSIVGAEAVGTLDYLPVNVSGGGVSTEQRYDVEDLGQIDVVFDAFSVQDRMVIEGGGNVLKDTGLISGTDSFNLSVAGLSEIIVTVTSDSAGTGWTYVISSQNEYPLTSDFYNTAASQDKPAGEVLTMAIYNDVLYLGVKDNEAKGLLQRYTTHIESIYQIPTLDSIINDMVVFDSTLYLACANGELYKFNGTAPALLERTFEAGLHRLGTDGNLLYVFLDNSNDIYTAYKNDDGDLNYVKTTLE